jgi:hypothetical protein
MNALFAVTYRPKFSFRSWLFFGWSPIYIWSEYTKKPDVWSNNAVPSDVWVRKDKSLLFGAVEILLCALSAVIPATILCVAYFVLKQETFARVYQEFETRKSVEQSIQRRQVPNYE